jgi:hypothetical protein
MLEMNEQFGKTIFTYGRAQAIADGVLIDVTKMAKEAGFTFPVAVTESVWNDFIDWMDADTRQQTIQNTDGRLWDVLSMLRFAIARASDTDCLFYKLLVISRDGKAKKAKLTQLKAVIDGGDNGEPVITIMLPSED